MMGGNKMKLQNPQRYKNGDILTLSIRLYI